MSKRKQESVVVVGLVIHIYIYIFIIIIKNKGKRHETFISHSRHTSRGMSVLGITLQRDNNMTRISFSSEELK